MEAALHCNDKAVSVDARNPIGQIEELMISMLFAGFALEAEQQAEVETLFDVVDYDSIQNPTWGMTVSSPNELLILNAIVQMCLVVRAGRNCPALNRV